MPNMADITVKKADGTTNVTYVAATPSAGDRNSAIWTLNTASGVQGLRPRLEIMTKDNGANTGRQASYKFTYPVVYTDSTTGLQKLLATVTHEGFVGLPKNVTTTDWIEAFAQSGNLLVSALIRSSVQEGYAPT